MSTDLDQSPAAEVAFDYDNLLKIIRRRYSVRRFRPDPVPDELIEKVLEAGRWAPSGANHQPWEFIVVRDRDSIQQRCASKEEAGKNRGKNRGRRW